MPVSKHRHKTGGKSVRHPGRGKVPTRPPLPPDMQAWQRFRDQYTAPFFAATAGQEDAHYALDIIAARTWRYNAPLTAISKADVVCEMAQPIEDDHPGRTAAEAERALAFLVEPAFAVTGHRPRNLWVSSKSYGGTDSGRVSMPWRRSRAPQ
jgi:hypothetical protein